MKILLIEDNQGDRDLLIEAFRSLAPKDQILTIEDGEKALAILKERHQAFDIVILDLNLPKKDGLEILKQIRIDQGVKNVAIVVLTTSRWQSDHDASRLLEADASFVKPVCLPNITI